MALEVVYFGDQSVEPFESIEDLIRESTTSQSLAGLLRSAFKSLSLEVAKLPESERRAFHGNSFGDLARSAQKNKTNHVAISTVLSCVAQLGWSIVYYDKRQQNHQHGDKNRLVVATCTGSLAAIALVASYSMTDFLRLASEITLVALRLGIEVHRRSRSLDSGLGSWAVAIPNIDQNEIVEAINHFKESVGIPAHKTVYVSARSSGNLTLSGPPTILEKFFKSTRLSGIRRLSLPIYGSFHAGHLPLAATDVSAILGDSEQWSRPISSEVLSTLLVPNFRGVTSTLGKLISDAITGILRDLLDFDKLIEPIRNRNCTTARLTSIGPAHTSFLNRILKPEEIERFGSRRLPSAEHSQHAKNDYRDAIAIVGMACRTPGAKNVDELWKLLMEGRDMHRVVPPERFDVKTHYDPTGKIPNTTITQWGCFDDDVAEFDLPLFRMSPREALQTDPCHRWMLLTGYEALESAGYYDPGGEPRPKFGTFYGQAGDDYRQVNSGQNIDTNFITGNIRAFGPGRVSYYFGWEGPSMNIDTACSSSGVAINQACSSLRLGECDMALAGGVNLLTCSDMFAGLSRARFVSTTGGCKTFDETADGYCRADGAGSIVLKRYEDALRDNDNILGVIRSIETAHAGTAISITHPEDDTQTALFHRILSKAGLDIRDIDHVEMHGTGTQAGDLAETTAIVNLVQESEAQRPANRPLMIASVKPNVGHSEASSGVTSLIKALLMFKHRINPKHIGIKTKFNPKLPPIADFGIAVPLENMPYYPTQDQGKRRILVNNFNATAGIVGMVVEEYSPSSRLALDVRGHYPIVLSAASSKSLKNALARLLEYLKSNPKTNIADLSYTLTARRLHHSYGFSCVASTVDALITELHHEISRPSASLTTKRGPLKSVVFVFTGQAVSYCGMGKDLFKTNDVFREHLTRSNTLCTSMGLPSFLEVINDEAAKDLSTYGPVKAQLALVALELALAHLFETWDIRPDAVIGHSLGEYSALCVSQTLSLADTLYLVGKRAQLMESLCIPGAFSMLATSLSSNEASRHLSEFPQWHISCLNGPNQTVLSGPTTVIESFMSYLKAQDVKVKRLVVDFAFHSAQMDAFLPQYERIAQGVSFNEPTVPMVSTYLGDLVHEDDLNASYLCQHARQPVKFQESIEKVASLDPSGSPLWIELGPAAACSPFISLALGTRDAVSALDPKKPNWHTISNVMAKHYTCHGNLRWDEYHKQYINSLTLLSLPSYPFDLTKHWIQYEGDWIITKNHGPSKATSPSPTATPIKSATLHRLENSVIEDSIRKLVFSSRLEGGYSPELGIFFNLKNHTYTAASIFTDMIVTAANETSKRWIPDCSFQSTALASFEITNEVPLPEGLCAWELRVTVKRDVSDRSKLDICISCMNGEKYGQTVRCKAVLCEDANKWSAAANSTAFLYQSRMDLLDLFHLGSQRFGTSDIKGLLGENGNVISSLNGIQEIVLNAPLCEAVAKVVCPSVDAEDYATNPLYNDALLQVPKFVLSQALGSYYVVKGWQEMRILASLQPGAVYRSHIRLQQNASGITGVMEGDLHVFDMNGRAVAEILKIQCHPIKAREEVGSAIPRIQTKAFSQINDTMASSDLFKPKQTSTSHSWEAKAVLHNPPTPPTSSTPPQFPSTSNPSQVFSNSNSNSVSVSKITTTTTSKTNTITPPSTIPSSPLSATAPPSSAPLNPSNPKTTPPTTTTTPRIDTDRILNVLASELGIDLASTDPGAFLEDMGVDSIMAMTLIAKMQEEVDEEVCKLPGGLLLENNSVAKLSEWLDGR